MENADNNKVLTKKITAENPRKSHSVKSLQFNKHKIINFYRIKLFPLFNEKKCQKKAPEK